MSVQSTFHVWKLSHDVLDLIKGETVSAFQISLPSSILIESVTIQFLQSYSFATCTGLALLTPHFNILIALIVYVIVQSVLRKARLSITDKSVQSTLSYGS